MGKRVLLPLANGFEEIEAVALADTMRRGGLDVVIAGVDGEVLKVQTELWWSPIQI